MELRRVAILDQIHQLTNDPLSDDARDVQQLKGAYNRIIKNIQNDIFAAPRDILDTFPSEVWIQIVKEALPVRGYSSALLLLTMVSNKWMQTLISVPTLWAYIELRGSQEDSLATVEAFRQLSRDAPVHLSIYVPTLHDQSTISAILMNIGPRIREVTIRSDGNFGLRSEETWTVLHFLLEGSQFNTSLAYIHLENRGSYSLDHGPTSEFMKSNPIPPSLRAIRGWDFEWRDFQMNPDYLERLEAIDSSSPIGRVLSHRIQLPNVRSLTVVGYSFTKSETEDEEEGFPSLHNLTSLRYDRTYREGLMRLLLCVAPHLVDLDLSVPYTKIPHLAAALPIAINLRTLSLTVQSGLGEDDERQNESDVCPVYQHIAGKIHGLSVLQLYVTDHGELPTPKQAERRGPFLSFLMSTISELYTKVGTLRFIMGTEHAIAFDLVLSYVRLLPELRTLQLKWPDGHFPASEDTYTLTELEYLNTFDIDVSHCFRTPNLLYLRFTWGWHRNLETLTYADLRKLSIDAGSFSVVELPESSFPSLQELRILFYSLSDNIPGSFKLTSFPFLKSITIASNRYQSPGTMLCFALLSHPTTCPSLCEISFDWCFPDWDILFLMLEKRNFMADSAVSLIRRITVPFIPRELCAPLASLLGGMYTERPTNNDLFMGGARELLLDEKVPGCIECLLRMKGGCQRMVALTRTYDGLYPDEPHAPITSVEFAWTEIPENGDPITLAWMIERKNLLEEFISTFATWRERYHRAETCLRRKTEMEISEDGVIAQDDGW